jgi:chromosome segregation ATPase
MQSMEDLDRLEQEFEDLLDLVKQNFRHLRGLDELRSEVENLQNFQTSSQNNFQNLTGLLERLETTQANLSQRLNQIESRFQGQGEEVFQVKQDVNQRLEKIGVLYQRQDELELKISKLEPGIHGRIQEEISKASTDSLKQIHDLEIHFGELYRSVRQSSQKTEAFISGFILVGLISFVGFIFTYLYLFSNE